jgi:hypothetical protein
LLVLFTFLGLAAIVIGAWQNNWSDALWLEVAKGGVSVVAVGVVGGALAVIWPSITARHAEKREHNDKVRAELVSLVAKYDGVKAVRRILRSLGLDLKTYADAETARDTRLTEEQVRGFNTQMLLLNDLQLGFESKIREFGHSNFFGNQTDDVLNCLGRIEDHLNGVLDMWEKRGRDIRPGTTTLGVVSDGLVGLFRIRDHFRPGVSTQMEEIMQIINKQVYGKKFGEASKEVRDAYEPIDHRLEQRG